MSDKPFPDPFAFWRDSLQQMQRNFNQFAIEQLQSEEFAKVAGPIANSTAATKRLAGDMANKYFGFVGLPTRADIQALDDRLQRIEDLLVNLTAALNQGGPATTDSPVPSRRVPTRNRVPPPGAAPPPKSSSAPPPSEPGSAPPPKSGRRSGKGAGS